jgi:uncharacterized Zn finger protein
MAANCLDDDGEIDSDPPSHDELGVTDIANEERLRIEQEHRSILEDVLQELLTEQPTSFDAIYEKYSGKCTTRELKKKLDKPRGRFSVKQYLREMENEGKLKRVMNVREYFYVVCFFSISFRAYLKSPKGEFERRCVAPKPDTLC